MKYLSDIITKLRETLIEDSVIRSYTNQHVILADERSNPNEIPIPCVAIQVNTAFPFVRRYKDVYTTVINILSYNNKSAGESVKVVNRCIELLDQVRFSIEHAYFILEIRSFNMPVYDNLAAAFLSSVTFDLKIIEK